MDTNTTVEKMRSLRLHGMSEVYYHASKNNMHAALTLDEFTAMLIDAEWEYRQNKKIENLTRAAGFKAQASPTNIDYRASRGLDKNMYERLLTLQFLKTAENIIITGPTGVGKSYLAQAIGHAACQMGHKTLYYSFARLAEDIKLAKLEGSYIKLLKKIQRAQLLIIDDFGLQPFDSYSRQAFMDIIENRYDNASTIVTAQIPVNKWHETIGEGTIADAILDRLVYSSHRIDMQGESLRKNKKLIG